MVQLPSTTGALGSSIVMKLKAPPYGNYPLWMYATPSPQFPVEAGGEAFHYHGFAEMTFWIRLGIRRISIVKAAV